MAKVQIHDWKLQGTVGLMGLLTVFGLNRSGLDVWASAQFYDFVSRSFPLRDQYLYSDFLHSGLKNLSTGIWLILLLSCLVWPLIKRLGKQYRLSPSAHTQSMWMYMLVSSSLCASLVAWLKSLSAHSCPWDLTSFGGSSSFFYLGASLADLNLNLGPGKCFPSGHASVGWMWVGLMFVPAYSKGLVLLRWAAIGLAMLVSVTQVVRGAHFPSHVLMTAVICWVSAALVYHAYPWVFKLRRAKF